MSRKLSPILFPGLPLALLLALGGATRPAQAQTATFNFDADAFGTATTFMDVSGGLAATFSSPADPGGFTVFPSLFTTLSGNVLIDDVLNANSQIPLDIAFSRPARAFSLSFAQTSTNAGPFRADFFSGGVHVASASALGTPVGPSNSEGFLSFSGGPLFDSVALTSPNSVAFAVDNLQVDAVPAVPEASTIVSLGLLLALGMGGVMKARRRKKRAYEL